MIKHINDFFEKFLKLKNNNSLLKKELINILQKEIKLNIKEDQIIIDKNKITINCSPLIKNEIFIKKDKILKEFNQKTNKNFII